MKKLSNESHGENSLRAAVFFLSWSVRVTSTRPTHVVSTGFRDRRSHVPCVEDRWTRDAIVVAGGDDDADARNSVAQLLHLAVSREILLHLFTGTVDCRSRVMPSPYRSVVDSAVVDAEMKSACFCLFMYMGACLPAPVRHLLFSWKFP